ncbi:hypothetical protein MGAST_30175 [Mycobacterium gastri 'Wayne']|nr:hypothetical protein MGAST_30175 [Mycobacterium gastri 'Wayne']
MDWLNPDGELSEQERARKRGIMIGRQEYDGMSRISGHLTPEARATFEPVLAKLAAPGACNPDDQTPVIDTTSDADAVGRDTRSQAQRNHDGLLAGLRGLLCSGDLGRHNGLPVSIVVTTTLKDLQAAAGKGLTGGGSLLPMSDLIRLASHANHYSPASGRYPQAHRHQRAHPGLRSRQPTRRKRLAHPQERPRRHRMDTPGAPRSRTASHQPLPSPGTIPTRRRRRRRTRLTL